MKQDSDIVFKEILPDSITYTRLFETTGWNDGYQANELEFDTALSNSWYSLSAYNDEKELIGFGRIISDGIFYAFVCDMIVAPAYQNQGIGSQILKKLVQQCQAAGIRVLWLFAAKDKAGFYRKHGFEERPQNGPGMQLNLNITSG